MSARFQIRIQRYGWDKASTHYERLWGRQVEPARKLALAMAALEPGEWVVDAACGPGAVTFAAADRVGEQGVVVGTDLSERMVERAASRARAEGRWNVSFRRIAMEDAGLEGDSYDAALSSLGLMYTPDPVRALERLREALRPGGRAVAAVWGARARCGWAEIFPIVNARVESEVCPLFFQLGTGDALARAFADAGFEKTRTRRIEVRLKYESAEDALGAAFAGGPVALAYSRFREEARAGAERDYLDSIERYRDGRGYAIPGEFVVAEGVRPA